MFPQTLQISSQTFWLPQEVQSFSSEDDPSTSMSEVLSPELVCYILIEYDGIPSLDRLAHSSAHVLGWAAHDGPGCSFETPPLYPSKMPRTGI